MRIQKRLMILVSLHSCDLFCPVFMSSFDTPSSKWSAEESQLLLELVEIYGTRNWMQGVRMGLLVFILIFGGTRIPGFGGLSYLKCKHSTLASDGCYCLRGISLSHCFFVLMGRD